MIRPYLPADRGQLIDLWSRVFGDPPDLVESFYDLLPYMGSCCVAAESGKVLGMAHLIHGLTLWQPKQTPVTCGYLYGVAVAEEARGRGLGGELSRGAAELGRAQGAELLCTLPAEESLYRWYERILNLRCRSSRTVYAADALPVGCFRISTAEYGYYREDLLQKTPHVELNNAAMAFQAALCEAYGGGLYRSKDALFCATCEDGVWQFHEVLSFAGETPSGVGPSPFGSTEPQGLRSTVRPYVASEAPLPESLVWNLTFD